MHDISSELCTRWNGGYPSGSVWAEAGRDYYALRLMACPGCSGPTGWKWLVAASATKHPGRTPAVRGGKTGWYKVCGKQSEYSVDWFCMPNSEAVYLGD